MIVFQAEHNILMHPFHMLGKFYASPTVHTSLFCSTLHYFWIPRNLEIEKSRFETRLNGESSLDFSFISQKFSCMDSSEENKKNSSGNNPVPNRMAPRQLAGIYMILCLVNNKRYYGESKNVSARLSQHKSRLRRNLHEISELQRDFNIYGEENFEFSPLWMEKSSTKEQRLALETEFIARFFDLSYNKFAKPNHQGVNSPFWGRTHNAETIERENNKNSIPEGFAVNVKGVIYPSISEASRKTNHSRDTLRRWLNDPNNFNCVAVDSSQPSQFSKLVHSISEGEKENSQTERLASENFLQTNAGEAKKLASMVKFIPKH